MANSPGPNYVDNPTQHRSVQNFSSQIQTEAQEKTKLKHSYDKCSLIYSTISPYLKLARVHAPIGTWLLFWPCAWSIALAAQPASFLASSWYIGCCAVGSVLMRTSGCVINDLWDRNIDKKVDRTKNRPIASGEISIKQAFIFLSFTLSLSLAVLCQFHLYTIFLGLSSMGFVVIYPFMKRIFNWPQLILGLTFNWGALLGWTAVSGTFGSPIAVPILLYLSGICWTLVYDTLYAHQDKEDDLKIGVKSTALHWGDKNKHMMVLFSTLMTLGLTSLGVYNDMLWPYYTYVALSGSILKMIIYSTDLLDRDQCNRVFKLQFWIGLMIFTGISTSKFLEASRSNTLATDGI